MTCRRRLRIEGRVQGVGFRWFVTEAANRCGVFGWVRNEKDGSVLCEAQGPQEAVDAFQAEVTAGPRWGRVDRVHSEELVPEPASDGFEITR